MGIKIVMLKEFKTIEEQINILKDSISNILDKEYEEKEVLRETFCSLLQSFIFITEILIYKKSLSLF